VIVWVEAAVVFAIHDELIAEHGGSDGLRDLNLLESALARPRNLLAFGDPAPDLAALAAAYAFGIARDHPFVDGNKRTSAVVAETFLELNETRLAATDVEVVTMWIELGAGNISEPDFAAWLRARIQALSSTERSPGGSQPGR
jgi:death-on-curing protein